MSLLEQASQLLQHINNYNINNLEELEKFRIEILGTKGKIKELMSGMATVPNEDKKIFGQQLNTVKQTAELKYNQLKKDLETLSETKIEIPDLSKPAITQKAGSMHPITIMMNKIVQIFEKIGFTVLEGLEIEDDWHNFTALNTPQDHPARDAQDTFYIQTNPAVLLRTHTSPAQIRIMETQKPPIRVVVPGRVYRNETVSARSHFQFHQIEGLYVDKKVSFADLKQTLTYFIHEMFGVDRKIRMRPSFFPFTEPSAEVDVSCIMCNQTGCGVCKYTGWMEILGCGMVDPAVLINCGINPEEYSGFAFGMGIDRQVMQRFKVTDIRQFFENDVRFLQQFSNFT